MEKLDASALEAAGPVLEQVILACSKGGQLYRESPSLARDVNREAGKLQVAIDNLLRWVRPLAKPKEE